MNRYEFYSKLESFKANKSNNELTHYGIIGQKWGTRRWQNADGTFNDEGKIRYFGKARHEGKKLLNDAKEELKRIKDRMNFDKEHDPEFFEKYYGDGTKELVQNFMYSDYAKKFVEPIFDDYFEKTKELNSKINDLPENGDEWATSAVLNALVDKNEDDVYDMYRHYELRFYQDSYITKKAIQLLRNEPSLFDEYKASKNEFDNKINDALKGITKEMTEEEKQKFINGIIDKMNDRQGVYYIDEYPNKRSPNTEEYGAPLNPKKFDKIEDMKNNLAKAEEICSKMKEIRSEIYPEYPDKDIRYGYDLDLAILDTYKKMKLQNKKFDDLSDKDWNTFVEKSKKKFAENKKQRDIEDHVLDEKYKIYLKLENTFGEMIWHFNKWDFVNEAKKNLGYDKVEDGKLTDAQWDNINKEIMENTGKAKYKEYLKDMKRMYG